MGATNIFEGKVVASDSKKVPLETGEHLKIVTSKNMNSDDGDISGISIRPELVNIFSGNSNIGGDNVSRESCSITCRQINVRGFTMMPGVRISAPSRN